MPPPSPSWNLLPSQSLALLQLRHKSVDGTVGMDVVAFKRWRGFRCGFSALRTQKDSVKKDAVLLRSGVFGRSLHSFAVSCCAADVRLPLLFLNQNRLLHISFNIATPPFQASHRLALHPSISSIFRPSSCYMTLRSLIESPSVGYFPRSTTFLDEKRTRP